MQGIDSDVVRNLQRDVTSSLGTELCKAATRVPELCDHCFGHFWTSRVNQFNPLRCWR